MKSTTGLLPSPSTLVGVGEKGASKSGNQSGHSASAPHHLGAELPFTYAVVLKEHTQPEDQLEIISRLRAAELKLCILNPDAAHPEVLCILAKAPKQLLVQEQTKLRVEHCTRTGEHVDIDHTSISAGAAIVLTERIMLNALSTGIGFR